MKRCAVLFLLLAVLGGCESNAFKPLADDHSDAAAIEQARIDLDNGDYPAVILGLADNYNPGVPQPAIARLLCSAYIGLAGIDMSLMFASSDEMAGSAPLDTFGAAFGLNVVGSANTRRLSATAEVAPRIDQAQTYLADLKAHNLASDADTVQQGLNSVLRLMVTLGAAVATVSGSDPPINQAAYAVDLPPILLDATKLLALQTGLDTSITQLRADLTRLRDASATMQRLAAAAGEKTPALASSIDSFLTLLCGATDDSHIQATTSAAIIAYLTVAIAGSTP